MKLPEIPHSWLIAALLLSMVILRAFGVDSLVTGSLMALAGYLTGRHIKTGEIVQSKAAETSEI